MINVFSFSFFPAQRRQHHDAAHPVQAEQVEPAAVLLPQAHEQGLPAVAAQRQGHQEGARGRAGGHSVVVRTVSDASLSIRQSEKNNFFVSER